MKTKKKPKKVLKKGKGKSDYELLANAIMTPTEPKFHKCCGEPIRKPHDENCPNHTKYPLVETKFKNGSTMRRYYAYNFTAAQGISDQRLNSAAQALAGNYPNIGDLWLRIGNKFIGARDVIDFGLEWHRETNELYLKVHMNGAVRMTLGSAVPIDDRIDFEQKGKGVIATKTRVITINSVGETEPPPQRIVLPTIASTGASPASNGKPSAPEMKVNNNTSIPVHMTQSDKSKKRYQIYEHPVTAIIRWMGKNSWTAEDCRTALSRLGLPVSDSTISVQLSAGRQGRGDIPPLSALEADQLEELIEKSPKPATSESKPKKLPPAPPLALAGSKKFEKEWKKGNKGKEVKKTKKKSKK